MDSVKVTVCITVLNEENTIDSLLRSLAKQSKTPDEIIIVDAGSRDSTVAKIKSYLSSKIQIKVYVKPGLNRSEGRNFAITKSKYSIIAITDAGCVPDKEWVEKITVPFSNSKVNVVAGFYKMLYKNSLEQVFSIYLGTLPTEFSNDFLPSARSLAFRKKMWNDIGGFPENIRGAGEDTLFNFRLLNKGYEIVRKKSALVDWQMPKSFHEFFIKVKTYAMGDIATGVFYHTSKGLKTHNIKVFTLFLRYSLFGILLYLSQTLLLFYLFIYVLYIYLKVYRKLSDWRLAILGILVQFVSDIAVMTGAVNGMLNYNYTK